MWHFVPRRIDSQYLLSYFDVRTLIEMKKQVSWICTTVIDAKSRRTAKTTIIKVFETNQLLRYAINRYCNDCTPDAAEEIAEIYGWPIGPWDVSNLQDFSCIFQSQQIFNEDISLRDVSNTTNMDHNMFACSIMFHQDLSVWKYIQGYYKHEFSCFTVQQEHFTAKWVHGIHPK
jgi:hypothetical protein